MTLYEQLVDDLENLIRTGVLRPGDRMPSVRNLTRSRSVSPGTVLKAYGILEDRGLIEARPRSGYYVARPASATLLEPQVDAPYDRSAPVRVNELVFDLLTSAMDREVVPLGSAFPSPDLYPFKRLFSALAAAARQFEPWHTMVGLAPGNYELRRLIARRYLEVGCAIGAEEIVITSGAMEALNICLQAVTRPGDVVAVESPTFSPVLQAIEVAGLRVLGIPTDPVQGLDLQALEQALVRHPVKACLFMPNFQNPLGSLMPDEAKQAMAELLTRHQAPLIEDDVYAELYFDEDRPKPAKAFDTEGIVMHCSSFTKSLAPGFRVGWVAPGRHAEEIRRRKLINSLSASIPAQLAIIEYLERGGYERHLRRLRQALKTQRNRMLRAIDRYFPAQCRVTRPAGGYFLWIELPIEVDALTVHREAMAQGISVSPGPMFSAQGGFRHYLRLNFGQPWTDEVDAAMQTLGAIIARLALDADSATR